MNRFCESIVWWWFMAFAAAVQLLCLWFIFR
jgi:hypothetical protein